MRIPDTDPAYTKPHQQAASCKKNHVCLTRFTTLAIQWHSGMPMQPISPISINVIANLPKYTLNKIVHTIHRKTINSANQLMSLEFTSRQKMNNRQKDTSFRGVTTFFPRVCVGAFSSLTLVPWTTWISVIHHYICTDNFHGISCEYAVIKYFGGWKLGQHHGSLCLEVSNNHGIEYCSVDLNGGGLCLGFQSCQHNRNYIFDIFNRGSMGGLSIWKHSSA